MSATAAQIATVRRKVAEPTTATYSDAQITAFIEAFPMIDTAGIAPDETGWTETYNLDRAAADIWTEKAAAVASSYDFNAAGSSFSQSQLHKQYLTMAEEYRKKAAKVGRLLP